MADQYNLSAPGTSAMAITPTDGAVLNPRPRFLKVTNAGNITMKGDNDVAIVWPATAGEVVPFSPCVIMATGTTASGILGCF